MFLTNACGKCVGISDRNNSEWLIFYENIMWQTLHICSLYKKRYIFSSLSDEENWSLLNPHTEQVFKAWLAEKDFKTPSINVF